MLTQRLGPQTQKDPAFIAALLQAIAAHPGCCDEVWLATEYGFPPMEKHRLAAQELAPVAKQFKDAGIRVCLQLSNTIGHGQYMEVRDCSGLVYDGSPVEKMVGEDGTVADYCFCWNGPHLRAYVEEELSIYLRALKPHCVWVDDDLRAMYHDPVRFPCFCPDCMRAFNQKWNTHFTREQLVEAINFGDPVWRQRQIDFVRAGMGDFTQRLGQVIHRELPGCRMGYQACALGGYAGFGYDFIYDAMRRSTGLAPASRPGGGTYDDHDPSAFIRKAELINYQNYMLPDDVTERRPEIENLPDVVFGKSIGGTCFETSCYLANGNTAMSYAMLMKDYEPMAWHEQMLAAFAAHRPYWEKLVEANQGTHQSGLILALPKQAYLTACEKPFDYVQEFFDRAINLRYLNVPVAFSHQNDGAFLLHADNARCMSDAEIDFLLHKPVVTDGKSVEILTQRGFDCGAAAHPIATGKLWEQYTSHPVNATAAGKRWDASFYQKSGYALENGNRPMEVLSTYCQETPQGVLQTNLAADALTMTAAGARWAVFGYDMWNRTWCTVKRDQLLSAAEEICGNRQAAELLTPMEAVILPRVDDQNRVVCVSVINCTVADSGPLELLVRNPAAKHFVYQGQYQQQVKLAPENLGENAWKITIPGVKPWAVGTVFASVSK